MRNIRILDCTLRDGGYINGWQFGKECIREIVLALEKCSVEYIELGLLQNKEYDENKSIYDTVSRAEKLLRHGAGKTMFGLMIEMSNYYPQKFIEMNKNKNIGVIRYSFWKRLLDEAFDYCKDIAARGYKWCCQPTRIEQYSIHEFKELCQRFGEIKPYAVYIVDTFGILRKEQVLEYAHAANDYLPKDVILGYHAHDNMGQAFSNVCAFIEEDFGERILQVDATITGMGRGAGNLRLEQILLYLNDRYNTNYYVDPLYHIWDEYLIKIFNSEQWGYALEYFIAAANACNPAYPKGLRKAGVTVEDAKKFLLNLTGEDKYLFNLPLLKKFIESVKCK